MSRTLQSPLFVLLCLPVLGLAAHARGAAFAQGGAAAEPRPPAGRPPQVQQLSPRLEKILVEWSNATRKIEKLEGHHYKYEYDSVFGVEKRAEGQFYYEAPDKGRIDIKPRPIGKDETSRRVDKAGTPFKLQPEKATRWVCTGNNILQIDDESKKVQYLPIPPENRGQRIMDGPLPFLFGMPPEMAKRRYRLELVEILNPEMRKDHVQLKAIPLWQQDAANYKEARVILNTKTWLPHAVQLIDPTGNLETVYTFYSLEINKKSLLFPKNPFDLKFRDYKIEMVGGQSSDAPEQSPGQRPAPGGRAPSPPRPATAGNLRPVPDVRGLPFRAAQEKLKQAGFASECHKGRVAPDEKYVYRVERQSPGPNGQLAAGGTVELTLYVKPEDLKSASRADARP